MRFKVSILIFALFVVYSCKPKKICAAYHSCFILSERDQATYFSLFGNDSVPKSSVVERDGNGLAQGPTDEKSWKKKHYYIPMVTQRPTPVDSVGPPDSTNAISVKGMKRRKGK